MIELTKEDQEALGHMRLFMLIAHDQSKVRGNDKGVTNSLWIIAVIDKLLGKPAATEAVAQPRSEPIKVVPAPRPEKDDRASWRALIASSLPEGEQCDFEAREFVPCYACSIQPGSPSLCRGCLANRQTIAELREARQKQLDLLRGLHQSIRNAAHDASCVESRLLGITTAIETEI